MHRLALNDVREAGWRFITSIALLVAASTCPASALQRGAWFWYQSSDPNGAANIVGNAAAEDAAIAFLQQWQITRLYGSYSNLPTSNAAVMGAWNKKLAQAGIDTYVVLSDANLVLPSQQASLQSLVNSRFVAFNNGQSDPQQRFVGIEMDLEPHTLSQWSSGTPTDRRDLLHNMRDAYANVRSTVVAGGYTSANLSAALPVWFDSSSTIGWANNAERDQWFDDIGNSLDAISLMAYETSSTASIMSSTAYERTNFSGEALVALRSKLGDEWTTYADFSSATSAIESQLGAGIDIESYYRLRQIVPQPVLAGDFNADGAVDAADYIAWRSGIVLANDPTPGNGTTDYTAWRTDFGQVDGGLLVRIASVPEPSSWLFAISLACCLSLQCRDSFAR
jgi:hypothetical protein